MQIYRPPITFNHIRRIPRCTLVEDVGVSGTEAKILSLAKQALVIEITGLSASFP